MDWNDIIDGERERLKRIVAWMLAFALLAERAYFAEPEARRAVLQFLRTGEAATLSYLTELAEEAGFQPDCFEPPLLPQTSFTPADAIRLALTLRALATMISAILQSVPEYIQPKTHPDRSQQGVSRLAVRFDQLGFLPRFACYPQGFIDTS